VYTYPFDSCFAHNSGLPEHVGFYGRNWICPLRSNWQVTYVGEKIRVDALAEQINTAEREIEESNRDLGLGDCEMQTDEGASTIGPF